jgi:hypothetical protein
MIDKVQNNQMVSAIFSHALFSCLFKHDDLVMQAFVCLHVVWLSVIWVALSVSALHTQNSDDLTYLSTKSKKNPHLAFK